MNWYRGLWRLTLAAWLLGLAFLAFAVGSARKATYDRPVTFYEPFATFHPGDEIGPCLEADRQRILNEGAMLVICGRIYEDISQYERARAAWESESIFAISSLIYWKELAIFAAVIAGWTFSLWGAFYMLRWVLSGFGRRGKGGA